MDYKFLHTDSPKIKSAATEVTAQKTQTPIVAKLTYCEMGVNAHTYTYRLESAFLSNSYQYIMCSKIKRNIPKKKKYTQFHTILS